jgi:hypothetical protein
MPKYDELERELIDHFKREYIAQVEETAGREIYQLMVEHRYGKGARDPLLAVDWRKVYEENQCPECKDIISLRGDTYLCGKCGLSIPAELFGRGVSEHKHKIEILAEDRTIEEKARKAKYDERRIGALYDIAVEEASAELDTRQRRREEALNLKEQAAQGRRGATIRRKGEADEKK